MKFTLALEKNKNHRGIHFCEISNHLRINSCFIIQQSSPNACNYLFKLHQSMQPLIRNQVKLVFNCKKSSAK